jgi:hypothetical protein
VDLFGVVFLIHVLGQEIVEEFICAIRTMLKMMFFCVIVPSMGILEVVVVVMCMFPILQVLQGFQLVSDLNDDIEQEKQERGDVLRRTRNGVVLVMNG